MTAQGMAARAGGLVLAALLGGCGASSGDDHDAGAPGLGHARDASADARHVDAAPPLAKVTAVVPTMEGAITSLDKRIDCGYGGSCEAEYPVGAAVTFSVVRQLDYVFLGWAGACAAAGMEPTCVLTVDGPETVSARFAVPPLVHLTVTILDAGVGEKITSTPEGVLTVNTQTAAFPLGTEITLSATGADHHGFVAWVGGQCGTPGMASMNPCTFGLGGDDTETAKFR
jgi:List-Bact-rpt repeat protein